MEMNNIIEFSSRDFDNTPVYWQNFITFMIKTHGAKAWEDRNFRNNAIMDILKQYNAKLSEPFSTASLPHIIFKSNYDLTFFILRFS